VEPGNDAPSSALEGCFEIKDEHETVDGVTRPTGRKVRVNLRHRGGGGATGRGGGRPLPQA
jgi:hypothetical protein